jgi:hypothetical protein
VDLTERAAASHRADHPAPDAERTGPEGNERLTAVTGAVLLALFAAEGLTILSLSKLLYWHYLIGFVLVGPICVKLASTLYRFTRYYTRSPAYRRKGPPQPLLRILGPLVVLTTLALMVTGILLAIDGGSPEYGRLGPLHLNLSLLILHKLSFLAWAAVMTVHVLAYIWRLPRLIFADIAPEQRSRAGRTVRTVGGRGLRWSVTLAGIGGGTALGLACVHLYANWRR